MDRQTSKPEYVQPIIDALHRLGSGSEDDVLEAVYNLVKDGLYSDDLVILPNGEPRWRNQAQHMIDGLIEDEVIIRKGEQLKLTEK